MDPRSPARQLQTPLGQRSADVFGTGNTTPTQPLTVRPRSPTKASRVGKENVPRLSVDTGLAHKQMHSPARKSAAYTTENGRHVQILEPPIIDRGRLKKRRSPLSPTSPASASSALSTGSSFVLSSTPRRRWFPQLFKFKPVQYHLLSTEDAHRSVSACRQLLEQMGVTTALAYEPSEDPATPDADVFTVKCWIEDMRDAVTRGAMTSLKGARFRVEVHRPSAIQATAGYAVLLSLVLEKGAATTLKLVYNRLRKEWNLDAAPSPSGSRGSVVDDDERFVEVVYAQ